MTTIAGIATAVIIAGTTGALTWWHGNKTIQHMRNQFEQTKGTP